VAAFEKRSLSIVHFPVSVFSAPQGRRSSADSFHSEVSLKCACISGVLVFTVMLEKLTRAACWNRQGQTMCNYPVVNCAKLMAFFSCQVNENNASNTVIYRVQSFFKMLQKLSVFMRVPM
jgi:hypothetical protein